MFGLVQAMELHSMKFANNIIRAFGKDEGLKDVEIHRNAFFRDKRGNIWFGTNQGST